MALLMSLLVLPLIALLAFTLTSSGINNLNIVKQREHSKLAAYVAEAGAEEGVQRLKEDVSYSNTDGFQRVMSNVSATANVTVLNNGFGSSTLLAPNGAEVPVGFAYVLSTSRSQDGRTSRSCGVLVKVSGSLPSPWNYAAFGYDSITLTGNAETDSYDSRLGTYLETVIGWGHPDAITQGGHVGTNSISNSAVNFNGNHSRVSGRIDIGKNGVQSSVVGGTAGSNYPVGDGAVVSLTATVAKPPVTVPALPAGSFSTSGVLPSGYSYGKIQLSGSNTLTLGNGVYVFDGLKLAGNAKLVLAPGASAEVYVSGNNNGGLDLAGNGVMNHGGIAKNLTFYIGPNLTNEISVTGNGNAYYRVYAPYTPVKIAGNGDIFGSVIGKTVRNVGNGKIHYDRANNEESPPPEANLVYRQRF